MTFRVCLYGDRAAPVAPYTQAAKLAVRADVALRKRLRTDRMRLVELLDDGTCVYRESGLCLMTETANDYYEIGGLPEGTEG